MLHTLFRAAAVTWSTKAAVVDAGGAASYAELQAAASSFAAALRSAGARSGDRVAVLLPNGRRAAEVIWGALEADCTIVPLHAASRGEAILQVIRDAEPRWLMYSGETRGQIAAVESAGLEVECRSVTEGLAPASEAATERLPESVQPAAIIYTSGSTGEPKGVVLSHANMTSAISMVNDYLQVTPDDVIYSPLPLSASYGLYQLLLGLATGATVVLDRSFAFPTKSLEFLSGEGATIMAAVPAMLGWMANTPLLDQFNLSTLRLLTSAAAALPAEHAMKLRQRLPHARLCVMYGQTECKRISWLDPDQIERRPESVGRGLRGQEHRVVNDAGNHVAPGEPGELQVRGPHVMPGYWRRPEETARKLQAAGDGGLPWLRTGDVFTVDGEGYLFFVGRSDEILKIGGHKVSPTAIENVLCQIPGVLEAAVTGAPDPTWGQCAVAHIARVRDSNLTEADVRRFCSQRLRSFMVPKTVHFLKELPKTASGKTLKRLLLAPGNTKNATGQDQV